MRGGESHACKVGYPITELVVTRRYEAALLTVEGVAYGEYGETKLNKLLNIYYYLRISGKR